MNQLTNEQIEALQPGDSVGVSSGSHYDPPSVATVTRRTATQVIVGEQRFNKRGYAVGGSTFHRRWLMPVSEAVTQRTDMLQQRKEMLIRRFLQDFKWHSLTPEQCAAIKAMVESYTTT